MPDAKLTIGEMCAEFGVTPRTLRYYEYIELISPERIGQKRLYSARDRGRLKLILRGKRYGFPLESIRQWLELYETGAGERAQAELWVEGAGQRIAEMEREIAEMVATLDELRAMRQSGIDWLARNGADP